MDEHDITVPEDPANPGFDVLCGQIGTRTHYIHNAMASAAEPLSAAEIGQRSEHLARLDGYDCKPTTFSAQVTRSHLVSMREKRGRGYAEQIEDSRWQLTGRARLRIASALGQKASTT